MSDVFQLLGTLRNKLLCTLRHLRQQLRHSLRASEIRLRRTVRTDFLLRVPPRPQRVELALDVAEDEIGPGSLLSAVRGSGHFTGQRRPPRGAAGGAWAALPQAYCRAWRSPPLVAGSGQQPRPAVYRSALLPSGTRSQRSGLR